MLSDVVCCCFMLFLRLVKENICIHGVNDVIFYPETAIFNSL